MTRPSKSPKDTAQRTNRPLTVMVVDDSAIVRQVMISVLSQDPGLTVVTAADPLIAMDKMKRTPPDVMVLDLEMPRMDGLTFLRKLMAEKPLPVVVCSALTGRGTETALRALEEGAVEVVAKPRLGVRDFLEGSGETLIEVVRAAAGAQLRHQRVPPPKPAPPMPPPRLTADVVLPPAPAPTVRVATDRVIVMGASTGGTEALREILEAMPENCPGIVIVQHMPELFTKAFAERLDRICPITVKEATDGDSVSAGCALIAPGNRHTLLRRLGSHYTVVVTDGPLVSRHRPSVDVLFRSAAQAAGPNAIGVIMTGMGDDGAAGLLEMKRSGAGTIAQDEASCVVFGMPKEAISRGAVDEVVPLARIPGAILRRVAP